jgi:hypothetical protein
MGSSHPCDAAIVPADGYRVSVDSMSSHNELFGGDWCTVHDPIKARCDRVVRPRGRRSVRDGGRASEASGRMAQ